MDTGPTTASDAVRERQVFLTVEYDPTTNASSSPQSPVGGCPETEALNPRKSTGRAVKAEASCPTPQHRLTAPFTILKDSLHLIHQHEQFSLEWERSVLMR